ncbi:MAG: molybdopterin-dependent oxidoreductase [Chloroflexi bacterium]|nr:molybdopterin-dependent oxidoreductase [Chloroflexota bacterium]
MALTRRKFLTLVGGTATGAVLFQACGVPEDELLVESPLEMPEDMVTGLHNWYATVCRQCPTPEGLVVRVMEGRAKKIEGNVDYPINRGRHSARCEASLQALYHPDRIKGPLVRLGDRGSGEFEEISWTDALGRLTFQLQNLQKAGSQSGMVMVTDPIGGHTGMVVERFVSRFGGRHLAYEPLERTTLAAAIRQVFGQQVMPDFDIENASYILSFGADFLNTWVSPVRYARSYGEFRQGDRPRGKLVHVDSRFSMTGANADEWFYVRPGTEGLLALSIAQVIVSQGLGDSDGVAALTGGDAGRLDAFAPTAVAGKISDAAPVDETADRIRRVAREFAESGPALAIGGGSAGAHTNGLFNLTSIYSLNHLVGSVGRPGGILFNPKPPLADVPTAPSINSFADWQRLVQDMREGRVQVLMVNGPDPWYGLPDGTDFKRATFDVPFIFSFSGMMDDTTSMADLILPSHHYLEDWGSDIPDPGPGYQTVGFQQPVVRPLFEGRGVHLGTRGFVDVLLEAAKDLELDLGLPGETFKDILQDGARQLFETGRGSVRAGDFRFFWNGVLQRGGWWDTSARSTDPVSDPPQLPDREVSAQFSSPEAPRTFHLMPFASASLGDGRGASLPWLQATPDPVTSATWQTWVEINAEVAREMGIDEGDVVRLTSLHGSVEALAYRHPGMPPDLVSVPIGQGHLDGGRYARGRGANVLSILAPATDGQTGALAWAATRVTMSKTGRWVRLPKFENAVSEIPRDEEQQIVQITTRDT